MEVGGDSLRKVWNVDEFRGLNGSRAWVPDGLGLHSVLHAEGLHPSTHVHRSAEAGHGQIGGDPF